MAARPFLQGRSRPPDPVAGRHRVFIIMASLMDWKRKRWKIERLFIAFLALLWTGSVRLWRVDRLHAFICLTGGFSPILRSVSSIVDERCTIDRPMQAWEK